MFCCNCDGGCREPQGKSTSANSNDLALKRFSSINKDRDDGINYSEFKEYVAALPVIQAWQALFRTHDANKDGKITLEEFCPEAAKSIKKEL